MYLLTLCLTLQTDPNYEKFLPILLLVRTTGTFKDKSVFSASVFLTWVWLLRMCLLPTLGTKAWNWLNVLCSFAGETLLASSHSGGKGSGEGWPHSSSSA